MIFLGRHIGHARCKVGGNIVQFAKTLFSSYYGQHMAWVEWIDRYIIDIL